MKRLAIVALSLATALTSGAPAMAFPTPVPLKVEAPQAEPVQYRRHRGGYRGGHRRHRGNDDWAWALGGLAVGAIIGGALAQPRYYGPSYYDQGYYDGPTYYRPRYRAQRYYAPSYYAPSYYAPRYYAPRYYAPRYYRQTYYSGGNAHVRWCFARYRSYRAYDNTFQPYYGPRRPCVSPY
ncbi:immunoreactive 14 kDa protein BA14k [Sinorhizobium sojae CCBAU 05684]|uniref:Lectin-like protein BA14k n=1 Tax=Sinorhizobium sojae CCBAU 05684 TaxID=716928 RepID=A0A249PC49_9HYPH|nr:BA14K family protein [Sinorhizobium sojae]ASY63530.1 immunoreactive 14 kDa protein BA14k [Sinorhizobium sojae CCBAU 05684]